MNEHIHLLYLFAVYYLNVIIYCNMYIYIINNRKRVYLYNIYLYFIKGINFKTIFIFLKFIICLQYEVILLGYTF